jgi:hypothetical protein
LKDRDNVTIEEQHGAAPGATDCAGQPLQAISPHGLKRRRFAKAGLGASGVIMTLVSQPGMATEQLMCTTASAAGSFTPTSHQHARVACDGRSPGYWKNHANQWMGAYTSTNAKFGAVFKSSGFGAQLAPLTLLEVLDPPLITQASGFVDKDNVGKHIVAALLNARSGRVPQLPEAKVFEIWYEYTRTGHYSPRPNTYWNGAQIVDYLKSTMDRSTG